jgi:hypothetical protein
MLSCFFVAYLLFQFVKISFFLNNYELLFIDERIIINDIYNVWKFDDEFYRYTAVANPFLKKILVVITELAYGGDLRYGRIWSNIFIILVGPLTLISDEWVITTVRIITIFVYFFSIQLLINIFLNKEYRWIYSIIFYSIPGVFYFNSAPKPDPFVILFIGIAFYLIKKKRYDFSLFILGIATGIKIVGIFALVTVFIYLLLQRNNNLAFKNVLKMFFYSWLGVVVANPILILPPVSIGNLPNFYKIYYNWLSSESMVAQQKRFSLEYFISWSENISQRFSYGLIKNASLTLLIIFLFIYLIYFLNINKHIIYSLVTIIGLTHLLFIFISVERLWIVYLNFSFIFLFIGLLSVFDYKKNNSILLLVFYLAIVPIGLTELLNEFDSKSSIPNDDFENVTKVIQLIEYNYHEVNNPFNIVKWDPSFGMPRNNVTYSSFFDVRENWESDELEIILQNSDFYVSKNDLSSEFYKTFKVKDFYIYTKNS